MEDKLTIRIGFVGLGIVGQGVWKHIQRNRVALSRRLGVRLDLYRAAVLDRSKKRDIRVPKSSLTEDPMEVVHDPKIDILCELMGGTTLARKVTLAALRSGKVVVSANKALICSHGDQIFQVARETGGHFFFEASVAGGIPIIKVIREGLVANRFHLIYGILNGTCNYILTRMEREHLTFKETVEEARRLGYMEADESLDLDGWDTAHKAVILAFLAHGQWVRLADTHVEGIRRITLEDIQWARNLGYKIKLLGIITRDSRTHRISVRVHPTLIPGRKILANVDAVFNGISVSGDVVGTTVHTGRGAGRDATASAVISDIVDAVAAIKRAGGGSHPEAISQPCVDARRELDLAHLSEIKGPYYLRLNVLDKPGVLAEVATEMANHGVSIASVIQPKVKRPKLATLILTTHTSDEQSINGTIDDLKSLKSVRRRPFLLRIADFDD